MRLYILAFCLLILFLTACNSSEEISQADTSAPTNTIELLPTDTPSSSPTPTDTATVTPSPSPTSTSTPTPPPTLTPTLGPTDTPTATPLPPIRQLTTGECCTGIGWSQDSTQIRFIDQPSLDEALGVWGIDVGVWQSEPLLVSERLGVYNRDQTIIAYPDRNQGVVVVENLDDGEINTIDTQGRRVSFTPDDRILWTLFDDDRPQQSRFVEIWLADSDGGNPERLTTLERGSPAAWLTDTDLLITTRIQDTQSISISTLSINDGTVQEIGRLPAIRDGLLSPDKRHLVYMTRFEAETVPNGVWLIDLEDETLEPKRLPFFGSYRWRNADSLVYVPFDLSATNHTFYEYNILTEETRRLTPDDPVANNLFIANNEWRVSPDGNKIAFVATQDQQLRGIWVIDLPRP